MNLSTVETLLGRGGDTAKDAERAAAERPQAAERVEDSRSLPAEHRGLAVTSASTRGELDRSSSGARFANRSRDTAASIETYSTGYAQAVPSSTDVRPLLDGTIWSPGRCAAIDGEPRSLGSDENLARSLPPTSAEHRLRQYAAQHLEATVREPDDHPFEADVTRLRSLLEDIGERLT